MDGKVAAGAYQHLGGLGLHFREELDAVIEVGIGDKHSHHDQEHAGQREAGAPQQFRQQPTIGLAGTAGAFFRYRRLVPLERTQHGQEYQRHDQRGKQGDDHRCGQIAHELPNNTGPEQ